MISRHHRERTRHRRGRHPRDGRDRSSAKLPDPFAQHRLMQAQFRRHGANRPATCLYQPDRLVLILLRERPLQRLRPLLIHPTPPASIYAMGVHVTDGRSESPSFISVACSHDDPASDRKPWIVRNLSQKSPSSAQDLCEPHPIENAQAEFVEIGRANVSSSARSLMTVGRTNQTHGPNTTLAETWQVAADRAKASNNTISLSEPV